MSRFKVGDRIRIPNTRDWNESDWLKTFIGQESAVAQLIGDGLVRVEPPIFGYTYFRKETVEHAGPLDFTNQDEGGIV